MLLALALAASIAASGDSEPKSVALGESFELKIGGSALFEAEDLQIGFEAVSADSRCPKGERCIREGEATVRVWLQKAAEARQTRELHTSSRDEEAVSCLGYEVELVRLDPHPVSGKAIEPGAYVATLKVARPAASDH